jgi:hypothetical protein
MGMFALGIGGMDAAVAMAGYPFELTYPKVVRVVRRKLNPPMRSLYDSTDFASDVLKSLAAKCDQFDFPSILLGVLVRLSGRRWVSVRPCRQDQQSCRPERCASPMRAGAFSPRRTSSSIPRKMLSFRPCALG